MKDQYVGDVSDFRKYALLRALSAAGANRIGVCWMLTPSDGSSDGRKLDYLTKPEIHAHSDPVLFDILKTAAAISDQRRLQSIEESGAIAGAAYSNELLLDDATERRHFMDRCKSKFRDADLVFFDPDNGLEVALSKGRKNSSKYIYLDELAAFYQSGKSLLIYQHFPRIERQAFLTLCANRLRSVAPAAFLWAFRTAHVVFLLAIHPNSPARLAMAAMEVSRRWEPRFISGEYFGNSPAGHN